MSKGALSRAALLRPATRAHRPARSRSRWRNEIFTPGYGIRVWVYSPATSMPEQHAGEGIFYVRFERSLVSVRFYADEYVTRSARRLLARLDQFQEVIRDFSRVKSIGQGFADEVFRVFTTAHPAVGLKRMNVSPGIEAVIRHVVDNPGRCPETSQRVRPVTLRLMMPKDASPRPSVAQAGEAPAKRTLVRG